MSSPHTNPAVHGAPVPAAAPPAAAPTPAYPPPPAGAFEYPPPPPPAYGYPPPYYPMPYYYPPPPYYAPPPPPTPPPAPAPNATAAPPAAAPAGYYAYPPPPAPAYPAPYAPAPAPYPAAPAPAPYSTPAPAPPPAPVPAPPAPAPPAAPAPAPKPTPAPSSTPLRSPAPATKSSTKSQRHSQSRPSGQLRPKTWLEADFVPAPEDVVCEAGHHDWPGNRRLAAAVAQRQAQYQAAPGRTEKGLIVQRVIEEVPTSTGFVKKDVASGLWYELGDALKREKVAQHFHDMQGEVRAKKKGGDGAASPSKRSPAAVNDKAGNGTTKRQRNGQVLQSQDEKSEKETLFHHKPKNTDSASKILASAIASTTPPRASGTLAAVPAPIGPAPPPPPYYMPPYSYAPGYTPPAGYPPAQHGAPVPAPAAAPPERTNPYTSALPSPRTTLTKHKVQPPAKDAVTTVMNVGDTAMVFEKADDSKPPPTSKQMMAPVKARNVEQRDEAISKNPTEVVPERAVMSAVDVDSAFILSEKKKKAINAKVPPGPQVWICGMQCLPRMPSESPLDAATRILSQMQTIILNRKVDVFVLPELCPVGYSEDTFLRYLPKTDLLKEMYILIDEAFAAKAKAIGCFICYGSIGWKTKPDGSEAYTIRQKVVNRSGALVATYDKMYVCDYGACNESEFFEPGPMSAVSFKVDQFTFGLLLCADIRYPNLSRTLARDHCVDAILQPCAFRRDFSFPTWKSFRETRAVENAVYFIGVNYGGKHYGETSVTPPWIDAAHRPTVLGTEEGCLMATVERRALSFARTRLPFYSVMMAEREEQPSTEETTSKGKEATDVQAI